MKTTRRYLLNSYGSLVLATALLILIVVSVILVLEFGNLETLHRNRITQLSELQQDELLNGIALENWAALREQLDTFAAQSGADFVELRLKDRVLSTELAHPGRRLALTRLDRLMLRIIKVRTLQFDVADDFESIDARLIVHHAEHLVHGALSPIVNVALWLTALMLISIFGIFCVLFLDLDRKLIGPLRQLTSELRDGSFDQLPATELKSVLTEISDLTLARTHFIRMQKEQLASEMAKQVAHDIRSPVSALNIISQMTSEMRPRTRELLVNAIDRINEIANQLIRKQAHGSEDPSLVLVDDLLSQMIDEKRLQIHARPHIDIQYRFNAPHDALIYVRAGLIKRAVSNLIENAFDALNEVGTLLVTTNLRENRIEIEITDDGVGMPDHVRLRLGQAGVTYGKANSSTSGSGLGFRQAREAIMNDGGSIAVLSSVGLGTTLVITLPYVPRPEWMANEVDLTNVETLIVVDDDRLVLEQWLARRQEPPLASIELQVFPSVEGVQDWLSKASVDPGSTLIVSDYEFNTGGMSGIEFLAEKKTAHFRVLLTTGMWSEAGIHERAANYGLRVLPKFRRQTLSVARLDGSVESQVPQ